MNNNQKEILKNIVSKNKTIFSLFIVMILLMGISRFASNIPKTRLENVNKTNYELESKKQSTMQENERLKKKLTEEEQTKLNLEKQNKAEQSAALNEVVGSKWKGIYSASQGDTELILEINEHNAVFNFGPTSENESVPKGSYYMGKKVIDQTSGFIDLVFTEWKEQPDGYDMVNLSGVVKGNYITGILTDSYNQKVGNFKLTKVQ